MTVLYVDIHKYTYTTLPTYIFGKKTTDNRHKINSDSASKNAELHSVMSKLSS